MHILHILYCMWLPEATGWCWGGVGVGECSVCGEEGGGLYPKDKQTNFFTLSVAVLSTERIKHGKNYYFELNHQTSTLQIQSTLISKSEGLSEIL